MFKWQNKIAPAFLVLASCGAQPDYNIQTATLSTGHSYSQDDIVSTSDGIILDRTHRQCLPRKPENATCPSDLITGRIAACCAPK